MYIHIVNTNLRAVSAKFKLQTGEIFSLKYEKQTCAKINW